MPGAPRTLPDLVQARRHPWRLALAGANEDAGAPTSGRNGIIPSGETR